MSKNNVYKFLDMAKISGKIKYAGFHFMMNMMYLKK